MPETHERGGATPGPDKPPQHGTRRNPDESARETVDELRRATRDAAHEAKEAGKEAMVHRSQRQKNRAEATLDSVAQALHEASETLRRDEREQLGRYTEQAAERVERLGDYLENRELDALFRDVQSMARRRPELFIGGCYFTGLLVGRFLRSSEAAHEGHEDSLAATRTTARGPVEPGTRAPVPPHPPLTPEPPPEVRR